MKRGITAWLAALLIVVQTVLGPLAYPMNAPTGAGDCPRTPAMAMHCGGCGGCAPAHGHHASCHDHAKCVSPCGHTPAVAVATIALFRSLPPVEFSSEPVGPACSPPLFDFLRPPN